MKIIRYLNDMVWGGIRNLYNRMGRKLKFVVGLAIAASVGWLVYDTYISRDGQLSDVSATSFRAM
tara:strand:- start:240 stop:434 length:195 start_codon:yes stop_codon:yes gene_type:complete